MIQYSFYLTKVIEVLVIGILVAYITTPLSIKLAKKWDIIDRPRDDRRVHSRPIPRFGGMGIFLGLALCCTAWYRCF